MSYNVIAVLSCASVMCRACQARGMQSSAAFGAPFAGLGTGTAHVSPPPRTASSITSSSSSSASLFPHAAHLQLRTAQDPHQYVLKICYTIPAQFAARTCKYIYIYHMEFLFYLMFSLFFPSLRINLCDIAELVLVRAMCSYVHACTHVCVVNYRHLILNSSTSVQVT